MKKLIILPLILSLVGVINSNPVEAKRLNGRPGVLAGNCTRRKPCSRMPEIRYPNKKCNLCQNNGVWRRKRGSR